MTGPKFINVDVHLARITKKNWFADPFITWAFTHFVTAKDSLVSRIWHSPALKDIFQKFDAWLNCFFLYLVDGAIRI